MARAGQDVAEAGAELRRGGLVGIPTETVYGLAARARDGDAVAGIFEAKGRPRFDPLIVHVASVEDVEGVAVLSAGAEALARAVWPGPLTLVLPRDPSIPDLVTAGLPTVAVRVPDHPLTLQLLDELGEPLAAPSANPFGYVSPTTAQHVLDQLGDRVGYVLDGGPCAVGLESTIVSFLEARPTVLRLGGLPLEALTELVGPVDLRLHGGSDPTAPGQLDSHYAPRARVVLGEGPAAAGPGTVGMLRWSMVHPGVAEERQRVLAPDGQPRTAARRLFAALRELDALGLDWLVVEPAPDEGLGRAINDRLGRAAWR